MASFTDVTQEGTDLLELKKPTRKSSNKRNHKLKLSLPREFLIAGVSKSSEVITAIKRPRTAGSR